MVSFNLVRLALSLVRFFLKNSLERLFGYGSYMERFERLCFFIRFLDVPFNGNNSRYASPSVKFVKPKARSQ